MWIRLRQISFIGVIASEKRLLFKRRRLPGCVSEHICPPPRKKLIRSKFQINLHLKAWHRTPYCFRVMKLSFTSDTRGNSGSCNRKYDEMKLPFKKYAISSTVLSWPLSYSGRSARWKTWQESQEIQPPAFYYQALSGVCACVRVCWNTRSLRRWQKWQMSPGWRQYLSLHRCIKIPNYVEPLIRSAVNKKCVLISHYAEAIRVASHYVSGPRATADLTSTAGQE